MNRLLYLFCFVIIFGCSKKVSEPVFYPSNNTVGAVVDPKCITTEIKYELNGECQTIDQCVCDDGTTFCIDDSGNKIECPVFCEQDGTGKCAVDTGNFDPDTGANTDKVEFINGQWTISSPNPAGCFGRWVNGNTSPDCNGSDFIIKHVNDQGGTGSPQGNSSWVLVHKNQVTGNGSIFTIDFGAYSWPCNNMASQIQIASNGVISLSDAQSLVDNGFVMTNGTNQGFGAYLNDGSQNTNVNGWTNATIGNNFGICGTVTDVVGGSECPEGSITYTECEDNDLQILELCASLDTTIQTGFSGPECLFDEANPVPAIGTEVCYDFSINTNIDFQIIPTPSMTNVPALNEAKLCWLYDGTNQFPDNQFDFHYIMDGQSVLVETVDMPSSCLGGGGGESTPITVCKKQLVCFDKDKNPTDLNKEPVELCDCQDDFDLSDYFTPIPPGASCDVPIFTKQCPDPVCPPPSVELFCDEDDVKYVIVTQLESCGPNGTYLASGYYADNQTFTTYEPVGAPQICEDSEVKDSKCVQDECGQRWSCVTTVNIVNGRSIESETCVKYIEPDCDTTTDEGRKEATKRKAIAASAGAVKSIKLSIATINTTLGETADPDTGELPSPVGETCPCPKIQEYDCFPEKIICTKEGEVKQYDCVNIFTKELTTTYISIKGDTLENITEIECGSEIVCTETIIDIACDDNNAPFNNAFTNGIFMVQEKCSNGKSQIIYYTDYGTADQEQYTLNGLFVDCDSGVPIPEPEPELPTCEDWEIITAYAPTLADQGVNVEVYETTPTNGDQTTAANVWTGAVDASGLPTTNTTLINSFFETDLNALDGNNGQDMTRYWTYIYVTKPIQIREIRGTWDANEYWFDNCCSNPNGEMTSELVCPYSCNGGDPGIIKTLQPGIHKFGITVFDWSVWSGIDVEYTTDLSANPTGWANIPPSWLYRTKPIVQECQIKVCPETNVFMNFKNEVLAIDDTCKPDLCSGSPIQNCCDTGSTEPQEICNDIADVVANRPLTPGWTNEFPDNTGYTSDFESCFTVSICNASSAQMIGMSSNPTDDASYTSLDCAFYIWKRDDIPEYRIYTYENGAFQGLWITQATDFVNTEFCIKRTGTTIEYLVNGTVIDSKVQTSTNTLYFDNSFFSGNTGVWSNGGITLSDISICEQSGTTNRVRQNNRIKKIIDADLGQAHPELLGLTLRTAQGIASEFTVKENRNHAKILQLKNYSNLNEPELSQLIFEAYSILK